MYDQLVFSGHAITRMAQRHLSTGEIEYVIRNGRRYRSAGVIHCFLGRRDIPRSDRRNGQLSRLEGTTVLLDSMQAETVITVYRNRSAPKKIGRKAKYNRKLF